MSREVEITAALSLPRAQEHLVRMHSVVNVVNSLVFQVDAVGGLVGDPQAAQVVEQELLEWGEGLVEPRSSLAQLRRAPEVCGLLGAWLRSRRAALDETRRAAFERHVENFESIIDVLGARVAELEMRFEEPNRWSRFALAEVEGGLREAMLAMARNSLGRWSISFSPEQRRAGEYVLDTDFRSRDGASIRMPAVLPDVVRDLTCNARKYSEPGTTIRATLVEEGDGQLLLQVEDGGQGIPEGEIEDVVGFGRRATNARGRRTMGGGFGLTKAYVVARTFGGRMWIRSGLGAGTAVTLRLPPERPAAGAPVPPATHRRLPPERPYH